MRTLMCDDDAHPEQARLQLLIDSVSDWEPTMGDYDFRTPLHLAACAGSVEAAVVLLDHGADPNARDRWDRTPLHDARAHGSHQVLPSTWPDTPGTL